MLIQCFGTALNANIHSHMLILDDVYVADRRGRPRFVPVSAPSAVELPPLVVFQPLDFPARLAAPVPRPRGLRMSSPRIAGPAI